jgi:hypothetical protein
MFSQFAFFFFFFFYIEIVILEPDGIGLYVLDRVSLGENRLPAV